jgi:putative membrane protein
MSLAYASASLTLLILGLSTAAPVPRTPVQQPLPDSTALGMLEAVVSYDIETGGLGAKKATNADVKQLASTFEIDHKALLKKTQDEAKKLGIKAKKPKDGPLAAEHAAAVNKLKSTSGDEFNRVWILSEIRYHTDAIRYLQDSLAPAIKNPDLKSFAQGAVPAFQGHLAAAQKLATKYHVSASPGR